MKKRYIPLLWPLVLCLAAGCGGPNAAHSAPPAQTARPAIQTEALPGGSDPTESAQTPVSTLPPETDAAETTRPEPLPPEAAATEASAPSIPESGPAAILARMSLEEKAAQLFVATPEALTGISGTATVAGETTRAAFDRIPVGGILYMGKNLVNPDQTRALLSGMAAISRERLDLPIFLAVDEEGGPVARISGNPAFGVAALPSMAQIGAGGDPEAARALGGQMGRYLQDLGFNLDFAPCADVLTNPENRIVRSRSFGSDPALVSEMARALAEGLLAEGVLPCYKHFPGHGGTAEDSHLGFAVLHRSMEELRNGPELVPFLDGAAWGVPMMMTGHISVPEAAGDELPASLSGRLIELLRGPETGYDGLLITDALNMGAVTARYTPGQAAVLAIQAGNDLLLAADHLEEAYNAVLAALRDGSISRARLDESVLRILSAKLRLEAD